MENYAVEMLHITKRFPGIIANDDITLQLRRGEIHALLGENGAGKSTLMSVLFGLYQAEEGVIKKNGEIVKINNPNDANALGIGMVHQHFKLVECFSVLDNIILGVEDTKNGILQRQQARKKVMELSQKYGLLVNPDAIIEDISVGMQQRTEILKMLYRDNEVLIFDEPTASLTKSESEELYRIIDQLREEGHKVLVFSQFVSMLEIIKSKLEENNYPYNYLTGQTKDRKAEIEKFQTTKEPSVFLLSLKAGGAGLNLTSASYVILYDPWWNPAVESQAIDRTHRIGQKNKVIAYRLLTRDSVEEKIRVLQHQKNQLVTNVLGDEGFASSLDLNDLQFILAHGGEDNDDDGVVDV